MVAKIQKWGNSQGLRLAKHVLENAGISVGDDVEIIIGEEEIRIKKKTRPKLRYFFEFVQLTGRSGSLASQSTKSACDLLPHSAIFSLLMWLAVQHCWPCPSLDCFSTTSLELAFW